MREVGKAKCMNRICIISRESFIKARAIKIKTTLDCHIEAIIKLANNGISQNLLSHARIPDGYKMFLYSDADGKEICQQLIDVLSPLLDDNVVVEKINC
jgi:hypothetical protein